MPTTGLLNGPEQTGSNADAGGASGSPLVQDPKLRWALSQIRRAEPKVRDWQKNVAIPALRFMAGKQLSDEDESILKAEGRPTTAFNTAQKYVRYISGVERDSPMSLMVNAINLDSTPAATAGDYLTKFYNWAIANCDGDNERSRIFEDMLVTGMGFSQTFIDRSKDPRGLIRMRRFSPLEAFFPENDRANLADGRWIARESWVDAEEVKAWFPDDYSKFIIEEALKAKGDSGSGEGKVSEAGPAGPNQLAATWPQVERVPYKIPYVESFPLASLRPQMAKSGLVLLTEFQWWENQGGYVFRDPLTGQERWLEGPRFDTYRRRLKLANIPIEDESYEVSRSYQKMFILDRRRMLGEPKTLPGQRFSINALCCHFDETEHWWYGFFKLLMDPQRYANKAFNQMLEALALSTKGGYIAETTAFEDQGQKEQFEQEAAKPGSTVFVADGALSQKRIQPKSSEQIPQAALAVIQFCNSSMDIVTGISAESLGLGAGTAAGVALKRRQRAGIVLLASEFDALREYRKEEAHIIFDHGQYIADDRMVLVGEDPYDQQVIQLVRDPLTLEYLVSLDEAEINPDLREQYMEYLLGPLGQTLIRTGNFIPEMLNALPFPRKWIEKIKQQLQQKAQMEQQLRAQGMPVPGQRGAQKTPQERQADTFLKRSQAVRQLATAYRDVRRSGHDDLKLALEGMINAQQGQQPQAPPQMPMGGA